MSDLTRIEQNNAELRECIEIAESLPDAPKTSFTMQEFIEGRGGLQQLYRGCAIDESALDWLKNVDLSKVSNADYMFYESTGDSIALFDTKSIVSAQYMFYKSQVKEPPLFDFSNLVTGQHLFAYDSSLTIVPKYNFAKLTQTYGLFFGCSKLHTVPDLSFPSTTELRALFSGCTTLKVCPKINMPKVTDISDMVYNCKAMHTIELDMRLIKTASNMFVRCEALTNLTLKNIKVSLHVGSGTSYGHLLTVDSLVGLCYELRDTGSVKTLTIGSANLEKLASVYVRSIEITDAMRAEDDLIDEKLPFERCESTDEGATLIADYVVLKNWKLA